MSYFDLHFIIFYANSSFYLRYVCITLAESFIFKALVEFFSSLGGWSISVDVVRGDNAGPFMPLFVTVQKGAESDESGDEGKVAIFV